MRDTYPFPIGRTRRDNEPVLVMAVFGATASGKTAAAEALSERIPAELVSADSMQVYRGLPILTSQPSVETKLVGIWPLEHEGSVAEYARLAHETIDAALAAGRVPVVVGGTGLYLRAALADLDLPPAPSLDARRRWESHYDAVGGERAHAELGERDPGAAAAVHPNDRRRIVRALELAELGHSLKPRRERLWTDETRHPTVIFGLDVPADVLERRIEARVRAMFNAGVEDEVRAALAQPLSATARQMIGLTEVAELARADAMEALAARHRAYASYQRKWMRRIPGLVSVPGDRPPGEVADAILEVARARQRLPARRAG